MTDESSLWKNPEWAKPKRKMDWARARQRQAEEKQALREGFRRSREEFLRRDKERNPDGWKLP